MIEMRSLSTFWPVAGENFPKQQSSGLADC